VMSGDRELPRPVPVSDLYHTGSRESDTSEREKISFQQVNNRHQ
jgi:hypothetical protein